MAARVQALWTLDGVGALDQNAVLPALSHGSPVVRAAGARLSERFLAGSDRDELVKRMHARRQRGGGEAFGIGYGSSSGYGRAAYSRAWRPSLFRFK